MEVSNYIDKITLDGRNYQESTYVKEPGNRFQMYKNRDSDNIDTGTIYSSSSMVG